MFQVAGAVLNAGNGLTVLVHGAKSLSLMVANSPLGFTTVGVAIAGGVLHTAQAIKEWLNARRQIAQANEALEHVKDIAGGESGGVDIDRVLQLAHGDDEAKRGSIQGLLGEAGSPRSQQLSSVFGAIHTQFLTSQEAALRDGKHEKWHAWIRGSYGLAPTGVGVATVVCTALGLASGGIALVGVGAVAAGAYFLYSFAKYRRGCKTAARMVAQDRAQLEAVKTAAAGKTTEQIIEAYRSNEDLRANKYMAAYVLYRQLVDRTDKLDGQKLGEALADGERDCRLRRKMATRYLLASGMNRHTVKALKSAADTAPAHAFRVLVDHLIGGAARARQATLQGRWNRFFGWWDRSFGEKKSGGAESGGIGPSNAGHGVRPARRAACKPC